MSDLMYNVPPTARVIWNWDFGSKSDQTEKPGIEPPAHGLHECHCTTVPQSLLIINRHPINIKEQKCKPVFLYIKMRF